jgi:hypothetical protein
VSGQLAISTARDAYAPGEEVSGHINVLEHVGARQLTVALEYRDWTEDYRAVNRSIALDAPLHAGDLEPGTSLPFSIALPADALPAQSGTYGQTSWGVHARLERLGPDLHFWQPVQVELRRDP